MSEATLPPKVKNLKGQRFPGSRLVPREFVRIQPIGKPGHSAAVWLCDCDCGKTCEVMAMNLKNGHTKSCGCFQIENRINHGGHKTPEYKIWVQMIQRCKNPNATGFNNYGGRGISVCEAWTGTQGFINFISDMGTRPSDGHSIERKNTNGNYCHENCCWATLKEQSRNKRTNRLITYNGITLPACDWDEILGFPQGRITNRIWLKRTIGPQLEKAIEILKSNGRYYAMTLH